jgi:large subunit ribosomal protein L3
VDKDGYEAAQLGFGEAKRLNRPERGHLRRAGVFSRHLREFDVDNIDPLRVGQQLTVEMFQPGQKVDVVGTSKGKGFQGGMKRHGFAGGPRTRGQSDRARAPGSIGGGTTPGRVYKGKKMAGHMGNARVTAKNLEVVSIDPVRNLIMIKGGLPGSTNGLLMIKRRAQDEAAD